MNNLLDWYHNYGLEGQEEPENLKNTDGPPNIEQELEQEVEKEQEERDSAHPYEDNVLLREYKNCVQAIGISEFLRNKLANYLAMTQVQDFDDVKKQDEKQEIQKVVNELSNIVSEL